MGARPGTRNGGGRQKGSRNKPNPHKDEAKRWTSERAMALYQERLAKDILRNCMVEMKAQADKHNPDTGTEPDVELYIRFTRLTGSFGRIVLPTETPILNRLTVAGDRDNPVVFKEGVSADEASRLLLEMIRDSGMLPVKLQKLLEAPIEGVANRDETERA